MDDWNYLDAAKRSFDRIRSTIGHATLTLGDDSQPIQTWQLEGYPGEVRGEIRRIGHFGLTMMPLPGAKATLCWQGGYRGFGTIIGIEDPRYRPTGLKGGEFLLYVVSGAAADGSGGTMKPILKGSVDGHGQLTGLEIDIGDANTTQVTVKASSKVVVQAPEVDISNGGALQPVKLADGSNSTVLKAQ